MKRDGRKLAQYTLEEMRLLAVQKMNEGEHPAAVAQALARNGYLVTALRHPGDNWQDRSLIEKNPERYFDERPVQASRVIDAILSNPAWKDRMTTDRLGPCVGALGHSAGGYTVWVLALVLTGVRPNLSWMNIA
jgi:predicted dienelactone hydrolase